MITSIELKNWKTHGHSKVVFNKGTNIIIGQMGAGKSSLMDAISFALFGSFPAIQRRRTSVNNLIRNKPTQQKNASVRLEFTIDNDSYAVERHLTVDGPTSAKLEKNGSYIQSQSQRVTEEIVKSLKVDYDLFSKAVYSEQNSLDYFLNLSASERKKQIDGLLGLDKFSISYENATSVINKLKDMIDQSQKTAEGFDIEKTREQLSEMEKQMKEYENEKAKLSKELKLTTDQKKELEKKLANANEENTKKIKFTREIAEHKSKLEMLTPEIKKIEKEHPENLEEINKKMTEIFANLTNALTKKADAEKTDNELHSRTGKLDADRSKIKKDIIARDEIQNKLKEHDISSMEKELKDCNMSLDSANEMLAKHTSDKKESEKWIDELKKHISKCPVCERDLSEDTISKLLDTKKKISVDSDKAIEKSKIDISKFKDQITNLNKRINDHKVNENRLKDFTDLNAKEKTITFDIEKATKEREQSKEARKNADDIAFKITKDQQNLKSISEQLERKETYKKNLADIEKLITEKTKELDSIKIDDNAIEKLHKEMNEVNAKESKYVSEINSNDRLMKNKTVEIEDKRSNIAKIDAIYSDVKKKKEIIENLTKFKNSLSETQTILRTQLIDTINDVLDSIWPHLYPYQDYQNIKLDAEENDYTLKVYTITDGKPAWEDVNAIASGGERSISCLAMRVAFAFVLVPNLKWLILDEPTHNIDREGMSKFIRVFNEMLPSIVDQIFIITHDEALKEVNSAKIYTLNRNKGENGETVIAEN